MSLPKIVSADEWEAARRALLDKEKAATRARDALNIERRELPMVEVTKDYAFEGPDGTVLARRPVRGSPAAHRVPLHVPPGLGRWLPELHGRHRRDLAGLHRAPPHARHELRLGVPSAAREARALEGAAGLGPHPVVLHQRRRLQLRLRRHHRRVTRLRRVQLPHARRVRRHGRGEHARRRAALRHARPHLLPPGRRPHLPHLLRVREGLESTGGSYYFLDLTALGRQEDWEEPKGRSDSLRGNQPDFHE